jgi:hypothetical protein
MELLKQEKEIKQKLGTKRKRCSFNIQKKYKGLGFSFDENPSNHKS